MAPTSCVRGPVTFAQHAAHNAMDEPDEIARFHERCSDLMRELLEALAAAPDRPRPFPEIEDSIGWAHRRIASVLEAVRAAASPVGSGPPLASASPA